MQITFENSECGNAVRILWCISMRKIDEKNIAVKILWIEMYILLKKHMHKVQTRLINFDGVHPSANNSNKIRARTMSSVKVINGDDSLYYMLKGFSTHTKKQKQ